MCKPGDKPAGRPNSGQLLQRVNLIIFFNMSRQIALSQIDEKRYVLEMKDAGIKDVMKLGIAFSGKKAGIRAK